MVNNVGFRKKFMIWINIISSIILLGSMIYHTIFGGGHQLSTEEMYVLLALMGMTTASYGAARALPGSPEYSSPELRKFDTTLRAPVDMKPPEPPMS